MSQSRNRTGRRAVSSLGAVVIIVLLGGYYLISGNDPLGLMGGSPSTPTISQPEAATATVVAPVAVATLPASSAQPATGEATWWKLYFSPALHLTTAQELQFNQQIPPESYAGSIAEQLVQRIDRAQKTIHIASFETDVNDVANALIRAQKRGVDVRWITDDESGIQADSKPGHGQFKLLKAAGIPVKDDGRAPLMHDKFWLFDGQTVWSGSTNITVSGMFEQNNNTIVIESPELAAIYERQFADMWSGKFNAKSPSTVDQQTVTVGGTPIQILFSPEDKAINHIIPYVQGAQTSIQFMAFTYTQDKLGSAMIERKNRGVDVRGVFESTGSDTEFSEMPPLYCAKAPVRQDGNPVFMHHKVIIIDGHIVITGSLNFTDNADQQNNENVLIIDNADIARLYAQEFQRVWDAAHDPDPADMKCK